jgi:hypothetical protein
METILASVSGPAVTGLAPYDGVCVHVHWLLARC